MAVKRRALGPEDPGTLRSVNNLAIALAQQGLLEDAVKLVEEALEIQRHVEGPESIFTPALGVQPRDHATPVGAVGRVSAAL